MQTQHNYYLEKELVNFGLGALWSSYGVICSPWWLFWLYQVYAAPKSFTKLFFFFFLKIGVSFASHSHLKMCSLMSTYLKDISGMFVNVVAVNKRLQQATVAGSMIKGAARSDW